MKKNDAEYALGYLALAMELRAILPTLPQLTKVQVRQVWAAGHHEQAMAMAKAAKPSGYKRQPKPEKPKKPASKQSLGGSARSQNLSPERRKEIASLGAKKRWAAARLAGEAPATRLRRLGGWASMTELTVYEVIEAVRHKAAHRTRYQGQLPFWDELLVAEIDRLTAELERWKAAYNQSQREREARRGG